jgi:hypothetical protein
MTELHESLGRSLHQVGLSSTGEFAAARVGPRLRRRPCSRITQTP